MSSQSGFTPSATEEKKSKAKANVLDAIKNVASKLVATPMGKGEKREATSPPIPPEQQYEKKSRDDESEGAIFGGDSEDEQHESAFDGSPSMHVFSKPLYPSDILQIASELTSMMMPEIATYFKGQLPDFQQMVRKEFQEATKSLSIQLSSAMSENANLKKTCSKLEKRVAKLELENDALE